MSDMRTRQAELIEPITPLWQVLAAYPALITEADVLREIAAADPPTFLERDRVEIANAPFILVEAKNHAEGVSQAMLSQFRIKMQTKRSTVRIGLLLSRTSVSADAVHQEERFSSDTLTIAFLNGDVIKAWIEAEDGTAFLERHIGEAMLG